MHDVLCAMHRALCVAQATAGDYVCTLPAAQDSALTMGERERALLRPLLAPPYATLPLYLFTSLPLYLSAALPRYRTLSAWRSAPSPL